MPLASENLCNIVFTYTVQARALSYIKIVILSNMPKVNTDCVHRDVKYYKVLLKMC